MAECGKESKSNIFQHHRHKFRIFLINMNEKVELDAAQAWSMILKANVTFKSEVAKDLQFPAKVSGLYLNKTEFCICSKCTTRRSTSDDLAECLKEDKGGGRVL